MLSFVIILHNEFLGLLLDFCLQVDMANSSASTLRSEIQNGHEAALGNTNLATGDAITSFLPQHTSATSVQPKNTATFIPIDEKGSSFGRYCKYPDLTVMSDILIFLYMASYFSQLKEFSEYRHDEESSLCMSVVSFLYSFLDT